MRPKVAIHALWDARVEFVLVGGWAAILNGSVTTTKDLDICYSRTSANLQRLVGGNIPRGKGFGEDGRCIRSTCLDARPRRLIAAKRAAGRPKDLQALPELESLLEASEE